MKLTIRSTMAALVLAACALAVAQTTGQPAMPPATPASTTPPASAPEMARTLLGQTEPAAMVKVPAVLRGRIAEVVAKESQPIKKGEPIVKLDDALQQNAVSLARFKAESKTEIDYAQTQLDFAKAEVDRFKQVPSVSEAELRQKELAVKQAEAYKAKMIDAQKVEQLNLAHEQLLLDRMTIRAPIDGYVHRIEKQAGEAVDENQTVAVVVQINKINANFFLPEGLFGKVNNGDKVTIALATNPPMSREATVVAVDPFVDPAGHLFRVKMEVDNTDHKIPVGASATWAWGK